MTKIRNLAKERMQKGGLALGFSVRVSRTVDVGLVAATSGFDWLFIDCEHTSLDLGLACEISTAALGQGVTPIVRVPGKEHHHASRVLDNGAQGVVVPHVETAAEAKQVVSNCKYPPVGHRSIARALPQVGFANIPLPEFVKTINDSTLVVVMVESPKAVRNADAIAAVKGVDVVLVGAGDFSLEAGIPGQFDHPKVEKAFKTVAAACRKHKKFAGLGGVYDQKLMKRYIDIGCQFVLAGGDISFVMAAAAAQAKFLRKINKK